MGFGIQNLLWLFDLLPLLGLAILGLAIAMFVALCALATILWLVRDRAIEASQPPTAATWFDDIRQ